ncbi:MAG: iron ABC transporter permease [Ignavibacteriales bacterium]|nr:iron ABC transporter permease [Ignavibacteriales bacterium]
MEGIKRLDFSTYLLIIFSLVIFLIGSFLIGILIGPTSISFKEFSAAIFTNDNQTISQIIFEIRLPRVLFAISVGGGLSIAGAVFQSVLLNPLAEPYILGISSGATFGAVLSFIIGLTFIGTQVFSFGGALLVISLVYLLGKRYGELEPNQLLLSGVMIGAFFSAGILLLMILLNDSLRMAVYWLVGNLSLAKKENLIFILPITFVVSLFLILNSYKYNLLSLGDESAQQLGLNVKQIKKISYIVVSLMVGTLVSVSGIIGFVGLLIPHVCRMIFGTDNRIVFPASFFIGAGYLTIADTIARTVAAPIEIPVGAITAIIGAPVFIYLLRKRVLN